MAKKCKSFICFVSQYFLIESRHETPCLVVGVKLCNYIVVSIVKYDNILTSKKILSYYLVDFTVSTVIKFVINIA